MEKINNGTLLEHYGMTDNNYQGKYEVKENLIVDVNVTIHCPPDTTFQDIMDDIIGQDTPA